MMRMASHDLKNPLSIIWGYVELVRGDIEAGNMPEMQLINGITRALDRMDKLIDELLDAERLKRESRFRDNLIHPAQIIRQSIVETEEAVGNKKQKIVENIGADLPPLMGDATQLRQAMINFLTNAIKYTPQGGTITVHASADAGKFHFAVEDTGIGIPLDMQSGIFNQLYRAMRPEIADIEGTGVGLSLVKEIVDRHKGQVWFRSQEGEGSVFGFWIPIQ
jgi:signal transduction histidine kinase